jgi:hypothetical protein
MRRWGDGRLHQLRNFFPFLSAVSKSYAAGLEMHVPATPCFKLDPEIPVADESAMPVPPRYDDIVIPQFYRYEGQARRRFGPGISTDRNRCSKGPLCTDRYARQGFIGPHFSTHDYLPIARPIAGLFVFSERWGAPAAGL